MFPARLSTVFEHMFVRVVGGLYDPPDPGTGTVPPGAIGDRVTSILQWLAWGVSGLCVAGVLVCAARMAISHRRGDDSAVSSLGWVLGACVLFASAGPLVGFLIG